MPYRPGCSVQLGAAQDGACYLVAARHYAQLRDALDRGETGWIELDSAFGDGTHLVRLEHIIAIVHTTPAYCAEREAHDTAERLAG